MVVAEIRRRWRSEKGIGFEVFAELSVIVKVGAPCFPGGQAYRLIQVGVVDDIQWLKLEQRYERKVEGRSTTLARKMGDNLVGVHWQTSDV